MSYRVAIVGATGNVGRVALSILAARNFPVSTVTALASSASVGRQVSFGENRVLSVQALEDFDFGDTDFVISSAGSSVSARFAPRAVEQGAVVIDNTSHFRMHEEVALVVPEVNASALHDSVERASFIIANPNCVAIPLVAALAPLRRRAPLRRVVVSTYQSVSGAGKAAMDELYNHTKERYVGGTSSPEVFPQPIAFNVLAHIGALRDDGSTEEEHKIKQETQKILGTPVAIAVTCVRCPVFIGHAQSVAVEFDEPLSVDSALLALREAEGVEVTDSEDSARIATPLSAAGGDLVQVSRLRRDETVPHGLSFWVVADNLRKGAALNAVQIAEHFVSNPFLLRDRNAFSRADAA